MPLLFPLILLVLIPLVEIYILIVVGQRIGALQTIGLCLLTAIMGAALLQRQGLATMNRARRNLDRGQLPAVEMLEGLALAVGGVLLLTPGFATDLIGFACLLPFTRRLLVLAAFRRMRVAYGPVPGRSRPADGERPDRRTIEGEFRRRDGD